MKSISEKSPLVTQRLPTFSTNLNLLSFQTQNMSMRRNKKKTKNPQMTMLSSNPRLKPKWAM